MDDQQAPSAPSADDAPVVPATDDALVDRSIPLVIGTAVNGLAAYAFIAIGTRAVGTDAFAPVTVLWILWSATAAVLTFPIQNWVIRTSRADGDEREIRRTMRPLAMVGAGAAALTVVVIGVFRTRLLHDDSWALVALAALVPIGSMLMGLSRGLLVSRGRSVAAGLNLAAENVARVLTAAAVAAAGLGRVWFAVALVAGFAVVALWPSALVPRAAGRSGSPAVGGTASPSPLRFLAGVSGGSLLAQLVLTAGPVLVALAGGTAAEVTALFGALAVFRAPYLLAIGASMQLTATFTGWVVAGQEAPLARIRRLVVGASAAGAVAAAAFGVVAGPVLVRALVGSDAALSPLALGSVAAGSTVALGSLVGSLVLVARGATRALAGCWAVATVVFVAVAAAPVGDPTDRVAVGLVLAETVALVAMAWHQGPNRSFRRQG